MSNLQEFKNEVLKTIPEFRNGLKLMRKANAMQEEIKKTLAGSYCAVSYDHLKEFRAYNVYGYACRVISDIAHKYGLRALSSMASNRENLSYSYDEKIVKDFFTLIRLCKNYSLEELAGSVTEYISIGKNTYYKADYNKKGNNKIKYESDRNKGGLAWHSIYDNMLRVIQLYEIAINNDIILMNLCEKLKEATAIKKLDEIQYKNIKIKCYQNGNIEITFADPEELEKFYNKIQEVKQARIKKEQERGNL